MSLHPKESFKDMYDRELNREQSLTNKLSLLVGGLALLGGAIFYLVEGFSHAMDWHTGLFLFSLIPSFLFYGLAIERTFFSIKRIHGGNLADAAYWNDLLKRLESPRSVTVEAATVEVERRGDEWVEARFSEALRRGYADAAKRIRTSNDERSQYVFDASRSIAYSFICLAPGAVLYLLRLH